MSLPNTNTNKDFTAITIDSSNSYPPNSKLFCNLCNHSLILLDPKDEEWHCPHCKSTYLPSKEPVKRRSVFDTPGPNTDIHGNITGEKLPLVSMVDDRKGLDPSETYKPPKMPASLEERLKRPGVNLLSYNTSED
jgi:hypothetical protein